VLRIRKELTGIDRIKEKAEVRRQSDELRDDSS
jgi:hypothetical protein